MTDTGATEGRNGATGRGLALTERAAIRHGSDASGPLGPPPGDDGRRRVLAVARCLSG